MNACTLVKETFTTFLYSFPKKVTKVGQRWWGGGKSNGKGVLLMEFIAWWRTQALPYKLSDLFSANGIGFV